MTKEKTLSCVRKSSVRNKPPLPTDPVPIRKARPRQHGLVNLDQRSFQNPRKPKTRFHRSRKARNSSHPRQRSLARNSAAHRKTGGTTRSTRSVSGLRDSTRNGAQEPRRSLSQSKRVNFRTHEKRGLFEAVRRMWRNYFSSKKASKEQELESENIAQISVVRESKDVEKQPQQESNYSSRSFKYVKSLYSAIQESAAIDSLMKSVSVCVSTVYESDNEDFYRLDPLPQPNSLISVLYQDDVLLQKEQDNFSGNIRGKGEPETKTNMGSTAHIHPEGEEIGAFTTRKSRRYCSLYPNFRETTWEFHPDNSFENPNLDTTSNLVLRRA